MRLPRIRLQGITRFAKWALVWAVTAGAGFAQQQSITNYVLKNSQQVSGQTNWWQYTYSADLLNSGPALKSATAVLSVTVSNIQLVAGQTTLNFGPVPATGQATSKNSFIIQVNRSVQFKLTDLH